MDGIMGITSFYFLCFFAVMLLLYYSIPRKFKWGLLLLCSILYYLLSGQGVRIGYPIVSVTACYAGSRLLAGTPEEAEKKLLDVQFIHIPPAKSRIRDVHIHSGKRR